MKSFLARPRSILGATLWGALVAVIVFFGLLIAQFTIWLFRADLGPVRPVEAIAVGNGYSIAFDATPAHALLAEYTQSVTIYGGKPRQGKALGKLNIPMNTGGSVRIGVLIPRAAPVQSVVLADRRNTIRIDLSTQKIINHPSTWKDPSLLALGIISGESYPITFITCDVWPMLSAQEQALIIHPNDSLQDFCTKTLQPFSSVTPHP